MFRLKILVIYLFIIWFSLTQLLLLFVPTGYIFFTNILDYILQNLNKLVGNHHDPDQTGIKVIKCKWARIHFFLSLELPSITAHHVMWTVLETFY